MQRKVVSTSKRRLQHFLRFGGDAAATANSDFLFSLFSFWWILQAIKGKGIYWANDTNANPSYIWPLLRMWNLAGQHFLALQPSFKLHSREKLRWSYTLNKVTLDVVIPLSSVSSVPNRNPSWLKFFKPRRPPGHFPLRETWTKFLQICQMKWWKVWEQHSLVIRPLIIFKCGLQNM